MTLHQLKVFVTIAKLQSFTLAAETLRVRQPSVSLLMQTLQRELDIKLFERLGNKIRLTTAGEELLRDAEELVTRAEGIKERVDEVKGLKKGKLAVGGSATAGATFLPGAVQAFKKNHPGIEVGLTIQVSKTLERKLIEGELDVAVLGWAPHSRTINAESYYEDEIVVIAPSKHPLTRQRSVSLEKLAKEPLVTHEKGTFIRDRVEERFVEQGLPFPVSLEVNVHFGARDAIKRAVVKGLGIGFISKAYADSDIKAGRLKVLKVPELKLKRTIYIAVHQSRKSSPFVQSFIEFLKSYKEHV